MKKVACVLACVVFLPGVAPGRASDSVSGTWEGRSIGEFGSLRWVAELREGQDGSLTGSADIPVQMLKDVEITGSVKDGTITMVVAVPDAPVHCEGRQQEDGSISGTYTQFGQAGTFTMKRAPVE